VPPTKFPKPEEALDHQEGQVSPDDRPGLRSSPRASTPSSCSAADQARNGRAPAPPSSSRNAIDTHSTR
jgi:hypothetical protein